MSHLLSLLLCAVLFAAGHSASPQWEAQSTRAEPRRLVENNDACSEMGTNFWSTNAGRCGWANNGLTCNPAGKCVDNGCKEKGHACLKGGKDESSNDIGLQCVQGICTTGHSQEGHGCQTCEDCKQGLECVHGMKLAENVASYVKSEVGGDWPNQGAKVQGICFGAGETGEQHVGQTCGWSAHCEGDLQCNEATHECVRVASQKGRTLTVPDCA
jgi:hypothetical protein